MSKGGWSKNAQIQVDVWQGVVGEPRRIQNPDRAKLVEEY